MPNKMREIIEKKDLNITKLITETGLSKSYFYDVMNGKSIPGLENARVISKAIGATLDEVFPDSNDKTINMKIQTQI